MDPIDETAAVANTIEGWLSEAQGRALYRAAAAATGRGLLVEIGSWKGRSTAWLARGARIAGLTVHAVDPHEHSREDPAARTFDQFMANMRRAGAAEAVRPVVMRSQEAVTELRDPVELLFIDGDHSVPGARQDFELWLPRVMPGGIVMCHDVATSGYSGPRRMFQRMVCRDRAFHRLHRVGSMTVARRTDGAPRTRVEDIRATIFRILLYWYDVEGAVKRVLRRVRRK